MDKTSSRVRKAGYPRRRALAACSSCRERKRKCDNLRPACSSCLRIGARCEYGQHDVSSFDAASLAILERLALVEGLVRDLNPSTITSGRPPQQHPDTTTSPSSAALSPETPVLALKLGVSPGISTDSILQWHCFQDLLSPLQRFPFVDMNGTESYTRLSDLLSQSDTSVNTYSSRLDSVSDPSAPVRISTDRVDIEPLVDQYFEHVNIKNPILTRQIIGQYCQDYYEHGPLFNLETCSVLLTCALGAISSKFDAFEQDSHSSPNTPGTHARLPAPSTINSLKLGHCYFIAAEKRLGITMSTVSSLAVQCLCLAGIYQMYAIKPMSALHMFHAAGSSLQSLLSTGGLDPARDTSLVNSSLFWMCYKSEREILTEIPIIAPALREPASPHSYPPPPVAASGSLDKWAAAEEVSWFFLLSEMALRRITDQVADVVSNYIDHCRPSNVEELIPVVAEFERQAETFREFLPPAVQFPDVPEPARTEWQQYSRGRYYRVLELMHRPFLFAVLHAADLDRCGPTIHRLAEKALFNAVRYLQHSNTRHRHHGKWLQLRNEFKAAALLLAASRSSAPLNMPDGWCESVDKALVTFEYWSWEFPSCETYTKVLSTLSGSTMAQ